MTTRPVDAARSLRPIILEAREEIEASRRISASLAEAMTAENLFQLFVTSDVGGPEVEPLEAYRAYEELARSDASVAWVAWNNCLPSVLSRYLDNDTRTEIFGERGTIYANSTRPSGQAVVADGGFRLSGRWSLVSGCELADWIALTAVVHEGSKPRKTASGRSEARMLFIPKGSYEILDTWYTGGLRGTGSHDVVVHDVFVPNRRICSILEPPQLDGQLHRFPFLALLAPGCASICLGLGLAAIEAFVELAADRPQVEPGASMRERSTTHRTLAEAEADLRAARLLLHDAVERVWESCANGEPTPEERGQLLVAGYHAARVTRDLIGSLYTAAGTSALYVDCSLERCHRDIWAVAQHMIVTSQWAEQAGRIRLGLESNHPLF